jgi:hypothetical protein
MSIGGWILLLLIIYVLKSPSKERDETWHYIERAGTDGSRHPKLSTRKVKKVARLYSFICYRIKNVCNRIVSKVKSLKSLKSLR